MINVNVKKIFLILVVILLLDIFYISSLSSYFSHLFKNIQKSPLEVNKIGFIGAYALLTFTVYYFGFVKQFTSKDMFILGICIYGIYDFTNLSTFKNWETKMVLLDTFWGGTMFFLTHQIVRYLSITLKLK